MGPPFNGRNGHSPLWPEEPSKEDLSTDAARRIALPSPTRIGLRFASRRIGNVTS